MVETKSHSTLANNKDSTNTQDIVIDHPRFFMLTDRIDSSRSTKKSQGQIDSNKNVISKVRTYLSNYLKIDDPKKFQILDPFEK